MPMYRITVAPDAQGTHKALHTGKTEPLGAIARYVYDEFSRIVDALRINPNEPWLSRNRYSHKEAASTYGVTIHTPADEPHVIIHWRFDRDDPTTVRITDITYTDEL